MSSLCQWTLGGIVGTWHTGTIVSHIGLLLGVGKVNSWDNGVGIQGRWLSLLSILVFIWKSKGSVTLSWGSAGNHSHLFQPVPRKVEGGLERRVSSVGVKQFPKLRTWVLSIHNLSVLEHPFLTVPVCAPQWKLDVWFFYYDCFSHMCDLLLLYEPI